MNAPVVGSPTTGQRSPSPSENPETPQSGPRDVDKAPQPSPRVMPSQMLRSAVEAAAEASAAAEAASDASFEEATERLSPPKGREEHPRERAVPSDPLRSILGYLDAIDRETGNSPYGTSPLRAAETSRTVGRSFQAGVEEKDDDEPWDLESKNRAFADAVVFGNGTRSGLDAERETARRAETKTETKTETDSSPLRVAQAAYENVRSRVEALRDELARRDSLIRTLEAELRVSHDRAAATTAVQLAEQRASSEAAAQRHLDLVDRLLADKGALADECAKLSEALHSTEAKHAASLEKQRVSFAAELKRHRSKWDAERKDWEEAKTKEVKELTVRGLEPEIQKLVRARREALADAETRFKEKLRVTVVESRAKHDVQVAELRETLRGEFREVLESEREAWREKSRLRTKNLELEVSEHRLKLASIDASRAERYDAGRREERGRLEATIAGLTEELAAREAKHVEALNTQKTVIEKRHAAELRALQLRVDEESATFKARVAAKARESVIAREVEITREANATRDAEIERVVARLRAETAAGRHDADSDLLRRAETAELDVAVTERRRKALENEAEELRAELSRVVGGGLSTGPGGGIGERLEGLSRAVAAAETRAAEAEETVRRADARRDVETAALESRVRLAIGAKDEIIAKLTAQLEDLRGLMA